ncbi:MAG: sigma-70 family RNA polymerase sigma factor [Bacteroidetes bacterium]|nr:sigma-70 family RNA polymerase sigma factor [Bacteroidota bacterium]
MAIKADITEQNLVRRCLAGETKSQRELYDKYSSVIFAICMRYSRNSENARDLLQESFIKVFDGLKYFRFEGSFEGWMKRVAVNTCLDFNKKLKGEPYNEELEEYLQVGQGESITATLHAGDLFKLLQKLPAGYRTVFNLYAIEGYSHQEIATALGITESTSKTQLFKARKMLQAMLARTEDT